MVQRKQTSKHTSKRQSSQSGSNDNSLNICLTSSLKHCINTSQLPHSMLVIPGTPPRGHAANGACTPPKHCTLCTVQALLLLSFSSLLPPSSTSQTHKLCSNTVAYVSCPVLGIVMVWHCRVSRCRIFSCRAFTDVLWHCRIFSCRVIIMPCKG